jgi:CarD family transcriptional regulator
MSGRKKAPKKESGRAVRPAGRSPKSSAATKDKTKKIASKAAKPARTQKKIAAKSVKAAVRASAPAKAVKPKATVPAAKPASAVRTASPKSGRSAAPEIATQAGAVGKKSDSSKKGYETLAVTGQTKANQPKAPGAGDGLAKSVEPKTGTAPVAETASASRPVKAATADRSAVSQADETVAQKQAKPGANRHGFKTNEYIVYPAHGVGQIVAIEEQEVAGFRLELFVITFVKDKMTLRVPTGKVSGVGMRKLAEPDAVKKALDILLGRARIKRTMWSRRAQEYETKINSGDLAAISEVVRDLYRSEAQPEQSYSERQLYEAALDRMAREVAVVQRLTENEALKAIDVQLQKGQRRGVKSDAEAVAPAAGETDVEEAA